MVHAAATAAPTAPVLPYRVGHGFDLHRLAEGYKLIIGGIEIPHTKGCEAHSDGAFFAFFLHKDSSMHCGGQSPNVAPFIVRHQSASESATCHSCVLRPFFMSCATDGLAT